MLENKRYLKIRDEYLKNNPICERCYKRKATQIHHQKGKLNNLLCDVRYFMAVDLICHQWIENNREEAYQLGYLLKRY
jgi:hypothetical protein